MPSPIPTPQDDDDDDVRWALSTAAALWESGERDKALSYLRRAAEAAGESGADRRALDLAKAAVDIVAMPPAARAPDQPSQPGERPAEAAQDVEAEPKAAAQRDEGPAPVQVPDRPMPKRSKPPPPPRRSRPGPPPRDSKPGSMEEPEPRGRDSSTANVPVAKSDDQAAAQPAASQPGVTNESPPSASTLLAFPPPPVATPAPSQPGVSSDSAPPSARPLPAKAPPAAESHNRQAQLPPSATSGPQPPAATTLDEPQGFELLAGIPIAVMRMPRDGQARIIAVGADGRRPVGAAGAILLPLSGADSDAILKLLLPKR